MTLSWLRTITLQLRSLSKANNTLTYKIGMFFLIFCYFPPSNKSIHIKTHFLGFISITMGYVISTFFLFKRLEVVFMKYYATILFILILMPMLRLIPSMLFGLLSLLAIQVQKLCMSYGVGFCKFATIK